MTDMTSDNKYPGVKVGDKLKGTISKDGVHPNPLKCYICGAPVTEKAKAGQAKSSLVKKYEVNNTMGKHEARLEMLVAQYPDFKNGSDKALCETTLKCEELEIDSDSDSDEDREKCFEIACGFFEVIRLNELHNGGYEDF